ncbi:class F sortase [Streptomyces sp. NPDC013457]|uniref:class F sortase n=1 Tax=Streptomyces sp. NPDC013457 TaxID=3364866 RepID=UPI0036FEE241
MRRDSGSTPPAPPPRATPSFGWLVWAALAGALLLADATRDDEPPRPAAGTGQPAARIAGGAGTAGEGASGRPAPEPLSASPPVRIRIPAIDVDALLMHLELDAKGVLQPPPATAPAFAGWYADGTPPGALGTAVVAGHVDTPAGPAVFHQLGAVKPGARIEVDRRDGRTAVFTVDAVEEHEKGRFPDDKVYGDSGRPELRLITCGGAWSQGTGYQANTVVYATLTATRRMGET